MTIPLSSPSLSNLERSFFLDAFDSTFISGATGKYISAFEQALAQQVGRKYAVACTNGTVALYMALKALGVKAGDEVIVPALTFVSPAAMVAACGAIPVFADVEASTWELSAAQVERQITPRTKVIIAVDVIGHPCNFDELDFVADGIPIIEDAAEAHGAMYEGRDVGSFGEISTFSFFANKSLTGGEAGAVLTDNEKLAYDMRVIANHGQTPGRPYWHEVVGWNFRLTNPHAAVAYAQVARWEELTRARQCVAEWYTAALCDLLLTTDLRIRPAAPWATSSCWLYTLHHPQRETILAHLRENDIDARAIWTPLVDLPVPEYQDGIRGDYRHARQIAAGAFFLPTSANMTQSDVEYVAAKVREAVR